MNYGVRLHVEGGLACFTRPEMKVERVSYDVITPSAARGILEAIYWKPQIRWVIDRIHVLKPIRFTNIRRNEVGVKAGVPGAAAMDGEMTASLGISVEDSRQQRAATLLRDVGYLIEAHFDVIDRRSSKTGPAVPENLAAGKHADMFCRRAKRGQCFHQPCLGCREFPARFALLGNNEALPVSELAENDRNRALGWMLHDIAYLPADDRAKDSFLTARGRRVRTEPRFFNAELKDGVITVPPFHHARSRPV